MALTTASTDAAVWAEYETNSDYDVTGDVAKAKLFVVACRYMLRRDVMEMTKGGATVKVDQKVIAEQLKEALAWWKSNDTSAVNAGANETVRYADFREFRS